MWTQLQLMENTHVPVSSPTLVEQDEVDGVGRSHSMNVPSTHQFFDVPDQIASTTELISTRRSQQCIPNKDVQKEASMLQRHWSRLVQK